MNTQVSNRAIRKSFALVGLAACTLASTQIVGSSEPASYTRTEATLAQVIAQQGNEALRQIKDEAKRASRQMSLPELTRETVTDSAGQRIAASEVGLAIANQGNQALREIRKEVALNLTAPALPTYVPQEPIQVAKVEH